MKTSTIMASIGSVAVLFSLGCGGGSESSSGNLSRAGGLAGIWTGVAEAPASSGGPGQGMRVEFFQTGTAMGGTSFLDVAGKEHIGAVSGTVVGNSISITVDYGAFGATTSKLTLSGDSIMGTSQRSLNGAVVDSGTTSITKSPTSTTPTIAGKYTGTEQFVGATNGTEPVALILTQNGNTLNVSGSINGSPVVGSGAIIGTYLQAIVTQTGTTNTTTISGSVDPNATTAPNIVINASYSAPGTNTGNNGVTQTGPLSLTMSAQ